MTDAVGKEASSANEGAGGRGLPPRLPAAETVPGEAVMETSMRASMLARGAIIATVALFFWIDGQLR